MKIKHTIFSILLLFANSIASEFDYEFTPLVGYNIAEGTINVDDYAIFGGEFQFNNLWLDDFKPEISAFYAKATYNEETNVKDKKTDIYRFAINGVYETKAVLHKLFVPFLKAGVGYENISDRYDTKNTNSIYGDAGFGFKLLLSPRFALKLEGIYQAKNNDTRWDSNFNILGGITFAFYRQDRYYEEKTYKQESKVATVNLTLLDDDKDNVNNEKDQCPNTTLHVVVDEYGCEIDSDEDGIPDSKDRCKHTPPNRKVDTNGCQFDSDGDGVVDAVDMCPNTPKNITKVDIDGCMDKINLEIKFKPASYTIKNQSSIENIKKFAKFLKDNPVYDVTIIGYTDSSGSLSKNMELSKKRAKKVKELLVKYGVKESRIKTLGKGALEPIASNETSEGRAKNRRIEAKLKKVIKQD